MRGAFRIGRLLGIDVAVDWSWSFIFVLMSWNLAVVFHGGHPTWKLAACLLLAVVAALLFFASVLAHEFAHALVAKSHGMTVREIRLFLFGGVSNIEREPPSPAAEFWMAIVGPLTSFGLGIGFLALASLALPRVDAASPWQTLAGLGPLPTLFFWLGPINMIVGVFNLIPGFPLDGGRVLRAVLWKMTGDLHKATLIASAVGRAIGWTFVAMGIATVFGATIPFVGRGAGSGLWLAFIGWFLASAADRSFRALVVRELLEGVHVGDLMRRTGYVVPSTTPISAVVDAWFMRSSERAFPVVENGKLVGLVRVTDVGKVAEDAWTQTPVTAVMTSREQLVVVTATDDAEAALRKFGDLDLDQIPVVERGASGELLEGMLSRSDVARWLELHARTPERQSGRGGSPALGRPREA